MTNAVKILRTSAANALYTPIITLYAVLILLLYKEHNIFSVVSTVSSASGVYQDTKVWTSCPEANSFRPNVK